MARLWEPGRGCTHSDKQLPPCSSPWPLCSSHQLQLVLSDITQWTTYCTLCVPVQPLGSFLMVKGSDPQDPASPQFLLRDTGQQLARVPGECPCQASE